MSYVADFSLEVAEAIKADFSAWDFLMDVDNLADYDYLNIYGNEDGAETDNEQMTKLFSEYDVDFMVNEIIKEALADNYNVVMYHLIDDKDLYSAIYDDVVEYMISECVRVYNIYF